MSIQKNIKNIPNILTTSRLFLVFPLILFLELNDFLPVFVLIIIGGLTDYFDGLIAIRLNVKTRLGAVLDPLSDKIFLLIPLIYLCKINLIPFWSLSLIIFREFIISILRNSKKDGLPASKMGKYKTFFFFISLIFFFFPEKIYLFNKLGLIFYWLGFLLTLASFIDYLRIKKKTV